MKEHKTDYNLLDLIENSSRARQQAAAQTSDRDRDASPAGRGTAPRRTPDAVRGGMSDQGADDDVRIYRGSGFSDTGAHDLRTDTGRDTGRGSIRFNVIDDDPGADGMPRPYDTDAAVSDARTGADAGVDSDIGDRYTDDMGDAWASDDFGPSDDARWADGDRRGDSDHYDPDEYYEPEEQEPGADAEDKPAGAAAFFAGVGEWFRTFPSRTADFFRNFPERMSRGWEHFKPEWRAFWKHAAWKKVWDRAFLLLLFPLCLFIRHFVSQYPAEVESFYSDGLNYVIRMVLNVASTMTRVPVFDVICWLTIAIAVVLLVIMVIRVHNEKKWHRKWYVVCGYASGVAVFLAVMFFIYQLNFGLNDYRMPLDRIMKMNVQSAETTELTETCRDLVFRAAEVRKYLNEDEQGVVDLPDREAVLTSADNGFSSGTRYFGDLTFLPSMSLGKQTFDMSVAKFTSFSFSMSRKGKTYTYQPFTGEVLVNGSVADYMLPGTVCQGLGAQMGFTDKKTCDFLAFLAAINHSDPYYNYSGLMLGLDRCMARLWTMSPAAYEEVRRTFTAEMERDIASGGKLGWFAEPATDRDGALIPVEDNLTTGLILSYYREGYMKDVQIGVHTGDSGSQKTDDAQETTDAGTTADAQQTPAPSQDTD